VNDNLKGMDLPVAENPDSTSQKLAALTEDTRRDILANGNNATSFAESALTNARRFLSPTAIAEALHDENIGFSIHEQIKILVEIARDSGVDASRIAAIREIQAQLINALRLSGQLATITESRRSQDGEATQTVSVLAVTSGNRPSEMLLRTTDPLNSGGQALDAPQLGLPEDDTPYEEGDLLDDTEQQEPRDDAPEVAGQPQPRPEGSDHQPSPTGDSHRQGNSEDAG